ncbi:MAG: hypothetical protein R2857_11785 [Vampirovibrionales bacterium]
MSVRTIWVLPCAWPTTAIFCTGNPPEWSRKADLLLNPTNPIVQDYIQQDAHPYEIPRPPRAHHNDSDEGPRP